MKTAHHNTGFSSVVFMCQINLLLQACEDTTAQLQQQSPSPVQCVMSQACLLLQAREDTAAQLQLVQQQQDASPSHQSQLEQLTQQLQDTEAQLATSQVSLHCSKTFLQCCLT